MTGAWDGAPPNPERDGWHWLVPAINSALPPGAYRWHAPPRSDVVGTWDAGHPLDVVRRGYAYLGPCLTPAEVAAAIREAEARGMERAAEIAETGSPAGYKWPDGDDFAACIRAAASAIRQADEC